MKKFAIGWILLFLLLLAITANAQTKTLAIKPNGTIVNTNRQYFWPLTSISYTNNTSNGNITNAYHKSGTLGGFWNEYYMNGTRRFFQGVGVTEYSIFDGSGNLLFSVNTATDTTTIAQILNFNTEGTGIVLAQDTTPFITANGATAEIILGTGGSQPNFANSNTNWIFNDEFFRGVQPGQEFNLNTNVIAKSFQFQTIDATPTAAVSINTQDNSAWNLTVNVCGAQDDFSDAAGYYKAFTVRNVAGTTTQVGSTRDMMIPNESNAAWDVTITESDPTIIITVTGEAAVVNWSFIVSASRIQ